MNLDRLKPAWAQFKLFHHFNPIMEAEILAAIGRGETTFGSNRHVGARILQNVIIALFLLLCCQGG